LVLVASAGGLLFGGALTGSRLFLGPLPGSRLFLGALTGSRLFLGGVLTGRLFLGPLSGSRLFLGDALAGSRLFLGPLSGSRLFLGPLSGSRFLGALSSCFLFSLALPGGRFLGPLSRSRFLGPLSSCFLFSLALPGGRFLGLALSGGLFLGPLTGGSFLGLALSGGRFLGLTFRLYAFDECQLEIVGEGLHVLFEVELGQPECLPIGKSTQRLGEISGPGHVGIVDEDGDDRNVTMKRVLDLRTKDIALIVETPASVVGRVEPMRSDERDQGIAVRHLGLDHLSPVAAETDRVDVLEDVLLAESLAQPLVDPPGVSTGV
jgi:hypothetical protein